MQVENRNGSLSIVEEPHLAILYYPDRKKEITQVKETLNVLSLFSGCGGMDLGFEGGFSVLPQSINEILTPNFIDKKLKNGFVPLKDVFKHLKEPENTEDLSQKFYSKAKFMGVSLRVGLSATSPRSFLAVGFPLLSLTLLKPC